MSDTLLALALIAVALALVTLAVAVHALRQEIRRRPFDGPPITEVPGPPKREPCPCGDLDGCEGDCA